MKEDFLPYLDAWETSVKGRDGFSNLMKKKMLLSDETRLGIRITGRHRFKSYSLTACYANVLIF